MQYAVIQTGGKQYKVAPGSLLEVEKLTGDQKTKTKFAEVLLLAGEGVPKVGTPTIPNIYVEAEIVDQIKGPKLRTAIYKAKSRYRRVKGHRQALTRVKITRIVSEKEAKSKKIASKPKPTKKTSKK